MIVRRRVECHLEFTKLSTSSMRRVFDRTWVSLMLSSARTSLPFSTQRQIESACASSRVEVEYANYTDFYLYFAVLLASTPITI